MYPYPYSRDDRQKNKSSGKKRGNSNQGVVENLHASFDCSMCCTVLSLTHTYIRRDRPNMIS